MPTIKPVNAIAHPSRLRPQQSTITIAIRCAAPLSTTSLPSIAPETITIKSDPRMSPIPFRIASATCGAGTPSASAAPIDTNTNARKACTLPHVTSTMSSPMAAATISRFIGRWFPSMRWRVHRWDCSIQPASPAETQTRPSCCPPRCRASYRRSNRRQRSACPLPRHHLS